MWFLLLGPVASAATLYVPGTWATVELAVQNAAPGDVIEIDPGTWTALPVTIPVGVTLRGQGAGLTHLTHPGSRETAMTVAAAVRFEDLTLDAASLGRMLLVAPGASVALVDAEVANGLLPYSLGAGVYALGGSQVDAIRTTFRDNVGLYGGGIALDAPTASTFDGCQFLRNQVLSAPSVPDGAGVRVSGSGAVVAITGSTFSQNHSDHTGAALSVLNGAAVTVDGSIFEDNDSDGRGGAIEVWNLAALTVSGGSFLRNASGDSGGAIACDGAGVPCALTVTDTTFADNTAVQEGGSIYVDYGAVVLQRLAFAGGSATRGGAIGLRGPFALGTAATIDEVWVDGSTATDKGGGIYLQDVDATLLRPTICNTTAADSGGGIYALRGDTEVRNPTMLWNAATAEKGGAIRFAEGIGTVAHGTFVGNSGAEGAAVAFKDALGAYGAVTDSVLVDQLGAPAVDAAGVAPVFGLAWSAGWNNALGDAGLLVTVTDAVVLTTHPFPALVSGVCVAAPIPDWAGELVDAADPASSDPDASRADLGATGGPTADPALWIDADTDGWPVMWDCDDTRDDAHPTGVEVPGDGADNDCIGGDEPLPPDTGGPTDTGATGDTGGPTDTGGPLPETGSPPIVETAHTGDPGGPPDDALPPRLAPELLSPALPGCGCGPGTGGTAGLPVVALALAAARRRRVRSP